MIFKGAYKEPYYSINEEGTPLANLQFMQKEVKICTIITICFLVPTIITCWIMSTLDPDSNQWLIVFFLVALFASITLLYGYVGFLHKRQLNREKNKYQRYVISPDTIVINKDLSIDIFQGDKHIERITNVQKFIPKYYRNHYVPSCELEITGRVEINGRVSGGTYYISKYTIGLDKLTDILSLSKRVKEFRSFSNTAFPSLTSNDLNFLKQCYFFVGGCLVEDNESSKYTLSTKHGVKVKFDLNKDYVNVYSDYKQFDKNPDYPIPYVLPIGKIIEMYQKENQKGNIRIVINPNSNNKEIVISL
ncbi:MAG: hypothetical protein PHH04_03780 [Thomasclavelia sp.]|nr:hypothetical protein [Thomasclavelia sp.]